jgi:HEPN domain-containing protein
MNKNEQARHYFRLGEQYTETAKILLETLISNGNSNAGFGNSEEDAMQDMERNAARSDMYLFIPTIFACLQSTELYIKGLLLLGGATFEWKHGTERLLDTLKITYGEKSDIYSSFSSFCKKQIGIIESYKQRNRITESKDLYMSLRYPEILLSADNGKENVNIDYTDLICNGDIGIEQFGVLLEKLIAVKLATVKEYHAKTT